MEFDNSFQVPVPASEAWALLTDIERIAPCMPGAELTEVVDEDTYKGKVGVRLGPVALTFEGQARFEERDEANHSARVKAQGSDARGRGGANALVIFNLQPDEEGGTTVRIHTDLQLSGSVAQYGRGVGMITDLSTQLIGQFADCLRDQLAERPAASDADTGAAAPAAAAPIPALGLGLRVLWRALVRWIKRLGGGGSGAAGVS